MIQREIVICGNCKGHGKIYHHEVTCYHKGEYEVITSECHKCDGTGRVWKITTVEYDKL